MVCIEKIISIIASLGTFGAAIIAYWTLREIKKQRIAAQRPQLLFKNLATAILDISEIQKCVPVKWSGTNDNFKKHVFFEMINAGQDVAINFETEFKMDVQAFINLINDRDEDNEIIITDSDLWINFNSSKGLIKESAYKRVNVGMTTKLEYLLTRSIQEKPSGFTIPEEYLLFNSCLLFLSHKHDFEIIADSIPRILLKTSFEDISGNSYNLYQSIETYYPKHGEFNFMLKRITKKEFYRF